MYSRETRKKRLISDLSEPMRLDTSLTDWQDGNYVDLNAKATSFNAGTLLIPFLGIALYYIAIFMVVWAFVAILFREGVYVSDITQIINRYSIHISVYAAIIQIVTFVTLLKRCRRRAIPYVFTRLPRTVDLLAAISSVPVLIGVSMVWDLLVTSLAEHFAFWDKVLSDYMTLIETAFVPRGGMLVQIVSLVILVPIAEELLFRGIILSEFKAAMPKWAAILLTGLIFAVVHGNIYQGVYTFVAGVYFGYLYVFSESILIPILAHMLFNFVGGILPYLVDLDDKNASLIYLGVIFVGLILGVVAFVIQILRRRNTITVARNSELGRSISAAGRI